MTAELPLPSWVGVVTSLLFVVLVAVLAARQRLHLTGDLLVAALRAAAPAARGRPHGPACHRSPAVPGIAGPAGVSAAPAFRPAHRAAAGDRLHQGGRADQPARRDDRADPGRRGPAGRDPLSDRGDVH